MNDTQETLHFLDYWHVITSRKEIVIAVSLLVIVTGIIITYSMPRVYMASAVIRVQEGTPDVAVFSPEMMRYDPLFLRTQFEIIQSRPIIEEVVRRRGLEKKLGRAYGYEQLSESLRMDRTVKIISSRMNVQQYRDTNLIEIQVALAEPKASAQREAAETANMIADEFRLQSAARSRKSTEAALDALLFAFQEQEKRLEKAEDEVERVREKYKMDMVDPLAGSRSSLDKMTLTMLEELRIRASQDVAGKEALLKLVESLSDAKLIESAQYLVNDQSIPQLVAQKRKAEVDLSQLEESYGAKYPDVVRVKRVITSLDSKISDALSGLKTGVLATYRGAQAKLETLKSELQERSDAERKAEAGSYLEFSRATDARDHVKRIRDALEMRYFQEQIELGIPKTRVELVSPAKAPNVGEFVSPNVVLNILLSVIAGLGAGIALAYFVEYLDTSFKTIDDVERTVQLPVLGVIPQKVLPMNEEGANPAHAEAYRILRANIQFSKKFVDLKTLCFTSGSMGEGKSLTLFNVAYVCAQLGDRVIIVDSDLHRPTQHRMLGVSNKLGLANVLIGEVETKDAIQKDLYPNFDFLPSGKLDSGVHGLLDTQRMRDLVKELSLTYDRVFFDAPPVIGVSDASVLAREVDGVMLLIQHRKYPKVVSERAKDMLENMGVNLVGAVLNNINVARDELYCYQQYYYQSDYTTKPRKG